MPPVKGLARCRGRGRERGDREAVRRGAWGGEGPKVPVRGAHTYWQKQVVLGLPQAEWGHCRRGS